MKIKIRIILLLAIVSASIGISAAGDLSVWGCGVDEWCKENVFVSKPTTEGMFTEINIRVASVGGIKETAIVSVVSDYYEGTTPVYFNGKMMGYGDSTTLETIPNKGYATGEGHCAANEICPFGTILKLKAKNVNKDENHVPIYIYVTDINGNGVAAEDYGYKIIYGTIYDSPESDQIEPTFVGHAQPSSTSKGGDDSVTVYGTILNDEPTPEPNPTKKSPGFDVAIFSITTTLSAIVILRRGLRRG
jgi:hypothetical protein